MSFGDYFSIIIVAAAGLFVMFSLGYRRGIKHGRDLEWMDQHFAKVEADRKRRGSNGQFIARRRAES